MWVDKGLKDGILRTSLLEFCLISLGEDLL